MRLGFAQINPTIGDFAGNSAKLLATYREAVGRGAECVLAPELALSGYPPRDLLFQSPFVPAQLAALDALEREVGDVPFVVGFIEPRPAGAPGQPFYNAAVVLQRGRARQIARKSLLPTYDVFDEDRYFEPAEANVPVEIHGRRIGLTICEDIWAEPYLPRHLYLADPVTTLVKEGATAILNLSASPFQVGKPATRYGMISALARRAGVPFAYCNVVGGNDQLVFDGNSCAFDARGNCLAQLSAFREEVAVVDLAAHSSELWTEAVAEEELHDALCLGIRDYLHKCGFKSVVLGLSGGIDSALVATLAAHALGPDCVLGVLMPGPHSSAGSISDATALAQNLGIATKTIPIVEPYEALRKLYTPHFDGRPEDTTEENLQSRLRGVTLMALSNKFGHLLLTTGNKSEMAVGYCTLYGDMCGGLAVISDVSKTMVWRLSRWINREREIIPRASIEKAPSAELRPNQTDQDTLPPYEVLDGILDLFVEQNLGAEEIVARGFDPQTVRWVMRRVDLNEYKRAQAVPGLKVTSRAFGIGRRIPIAQRFVQ
ncbi:MAG: NAD+ synthase [Verrucomicrobia bacterium]|nr:NAD+ synthase [Verrucomicrobiota bacterium]